MTTPKGDLFVWIGLAAVLSGALGFKFGYQMGEDSAKKRAVAILEQLGEDIRAGPPPGWKPKEDRP